MFHKAIALPQIISNVAAQQNLYSNLVTGYELTREEVILNHVNWHEVQTLPVSKVYDVSIDDDAERFVFTPLQYKPFAYNGEVYVQMS